MRRLPRFPSTRFAVPLLCFAAGAVVAVAALEDWPRRIASAVRTRADPEEGSGPVAEMTRLRRTIAAGKTRQAALLGDSITAEGRWEGNLGDFRLLNFGVGGDRTAELLARLPALEQQRPARVFVMAGINDIFTGVEPRHTVETYDAIVTRLKAIGSRVMVVSVLPLSRQNSHYRSVNDRVAALNDALRALAVRQGVAYLDLATEFTVPGEFVLADEYTVDSVHLNGLAYARWTLRLEKVLAAVESPAGDGRSLPR